MPKEMKRQILSVRLVLLAVAVFALAFAVFATGWFLGGGIWRGGVPVFEVSLYSDAPDVLQLGVSSCHGDPELAEFWETDKDVQVRIVASSTPFMDDPDCNDVVSVQLREPLGNRAVVDLHTEERVRVTTVGLVDQ